MRPDRQRRPRHRFLQAPEPDPVARRRRAHLRGRAGIVLDDLNRQLKKHGLWFPVDVSTASRATIGGMAGNNSCGGRSLALRHHARQHAVDGRRAGRRHAAAFRRGVARSRRARMRPTAGSPCSATCSISARAKPRRSPSASQRCSAGSAATISMRWCRAMRRNNMAHLLVGSEGTLAFTTQGRAEAVAGDPQQGARRLPFRQFLRGDGCGPASGQAAADRGRTGRPHHAGARPRHRDVPADHRRRRCAAIPMRC